MTDSGWKEEMNLPQSTARVPIYCSEDDKEEWDEEVEERGYRSRSAYLYELIQEARAYREKGFLAHHQSEERIQELENKVESLERQLEQQEQKQGGRIQVDDPEFIQKFLTDQYQTLDELLRKIVESGALDDLIRERIEDQLYFLAQQDRVEFERGYGWKLVNGGDH